MLCHKDIKTHKNPYAPVYRICICISDSKQPIYHLHLHHITMQQWLFFLHLFFQVICWGCVTHVDSKIFSGDNFENWKKGPSQIIEGGSQNFKKGYLKIELQKQSKTLANLSDFRQTDQGLFRAGGVRGLYRSLWTVLWFHI